MRISIEDTEQFTSRDRQGTIHRLGAWNRTRTIGSVLCMLSLLVTAGAASASFQLQSDGRQIYHSLNATLYPTAPFADFNQSWWAWEAGSAQNSIVGQFSLQGTGSAYEGIDATHYGARASSNFSVVFSVAQDAEVELTGTLQHELFSWSAATVSLTQSGVGTVFQFAVDGMNDVYSMPVAWSGTLSPGTYTLSASALPGGPGNNEGYDGASFDFALVAVAPPVPVLGTWAIGLTAASLTCLGVRNARRECGATSSPGTAGGHRPSR